MLGEVAAAGESLGTPMTDSANGKQYRAHVQGGQWSVVADVIGGRSRIPQPPAPASGPSLILATSLIWTPEPYGV